MGSRIFSIIFMLSIVVGLGQFASLGSVFAYDFATNEPNTIPLWGPTWAQDEVTVSVDAGRGVTPEAVQMVEQAIQDWNAAIETKFPSLFSFIQVESGADVTVKVKKGGGSIQGQALCSSDDQRFFTNCKLNVSGRAFGSDNSGDAVLSIAIQELGHALGLLHSNHIADVMFGTVQPTPNTQISHCDMDAWAAVMDWLVMDNSPAPPNVNSVSCGGGGGGGGGGDIVAHVEEITPFTVGRKNELRITHLIEDDAGNAVDGARVTVRLTLPDGNVLTGAATTNANGEATLRLRQKAKNGIYTSEVTNIEKANLTYDKCGTSDPTPPDESTVEYPLTGGVVGLVTVIDDCS